MDVMTFLEAVTKFAIAIEVAIAVLLVYLNWRETRFLKALRPLLPTDEQLPLFEALASRANYVTRVAAYFIVLTVLGTIGVNLGEIFPPLRAFNAALLLGLLAGPRQVGVALRKRVRDQAANGGVT